MAENTNLFASIRDNITEGNIKEALTALNTWSVNSESRLSDETTQLLAHYNSNERSFNLGTIGNSDYEIEKNKITKAGLILLEEAKNAANKTISKSTPVAHSTPNDYSSQTVSSGSSPMDFIKKNMLWFGIGLAVLILLFLYILGSTEVVVEESASPSTYQTK